MSMGTRAPSMASPEPTSGAPLVVLSMARKSLEMMLAVELLSTCGS
jgi:hypothetical protein